MSTHPWEDALDNARKREAARRERLGEHGRTLENLIDGFTDAVKHDNVLGFFERLAAELVELRKRPTAVKSIQEMVDEEDRAEDEERGVAD